MPGCFVFGCHNGYKRGDQLRSFQLPRNCTDDIRHKWISIMYKSRSDKKFDPSNRNHRICHEHFEEKFLVKVEVIKVGDQTVEIQRKKWTLTADAIPTIFKSIPKIPVKVSPKKRKLPKDRTFSFQSKKPLMTYELSEDNRTSNIDTSSSADSSGTAFVSTKMPPSNPDIDLKSLVAEAWVKIHSDFKGWELRFGENYGKTSCFIFEVDLTAPAKIIRQLVIGEDLIPKAFLGTLEITKKIAVTKLTCAEEIGNCLAQLQRLRLCSGVSLPTSLLSKTQSKASLNASTVCFSKTCEIFGPNLVCVPCKLLSTRIGRNEVQKTPKEQKLEPSKLQIRNSLYRRRIRRLLVKQKNTKVELLELRSAIKNLDATTLKRKLEGLKSLEIDHGTRLTLIEIVKAAKASSSKGNRYSTEWLLESSLLKIKSPAAYKHLRDTKMLPLPHPSTIKRLISGSPCEFGFSTSALESIRREMVGKKRRDRQGVLVFDEVKLRKTLDFNKGTLKFDGYVNFGEFTEELTEKVELADHALVYAFRPYNASWVQPVAVYATKGAAKGPTLARLLLECVIRLETVGVEVLATVSDGASTNKNLWKKLGISGSKGNICNKVVHPCDETRALFFCSDVPHIVKCIRNHFEKYRKLKFDGLEINYDFYEELYNLDMANDTGLRRCPKLTKAHIWPNSFEKMRVNYATQLFSSTVASGINFYRKLCQFKLTGSEATETFTLKINNLFDVLNSRLPKEGLKPKSEKIEILESFLKMLSSDTENTFASKQTIESLQVSIKTTIEITDYLSSKLGFLYVLTSKLNQDCLERFFGLVRAAGGREEHPTVSNFLQLYRLLSIYSPIKRAVRGNTSDVERLTILSNLADSFKFEAQVSKIQRSDTRRLWETTLQEKIKTTRSMHLNFSQYVSTSSNVEKNLVYHLAGFVVKKASKLLDCQDCVLSLRAGSHLPASSFLTQSLDKGTGKLTFPSTALFELLLKTVEPVISSAMANGELYGDVLLRIIERISDINPTLIGCEEPEHASNTLCKLIPYYIMMRFHFYSNSVKQDITKLTRTQRKLSKLQDD